VTGEIEVAGVVIHSKHRHMVGPLIAAVKEIAGRIE
jgi:hypothetical protein